VADEKAGIDLMKGEKEGGETGMRGLKGEEKRKGGKRGAREAKGERGDWWSKPVHS
jgi:hypothetical protein